RRRLEQAGETSALGNHPVVGRFSKTFEQGLTGPVVRFFLAEEQAQLGEAMPRLVIRRVTFQALFPRDTRKLEPVRRSRNHSHLSGGAIRIQFNGPTKGGNRLLRITVDEQGLAQSNERLVTFGAEGNCGLIEAG